MEDILWSVCFQESRIYISQSIQNFHVCWKNEAKISGKVQFWSEKELKFQMK